MQDSKLQKSWYSYNYRIRAHNKKSKAKYFGGGSDTQLSFDQYVSWKEESHKDVLSRINARLNRAILKLEQAMGKRIFTDKNICNKCGEEKTLIKFCVTWKPEVKIRDICRDCESKRISESLKTRLKSISRASK